MIVIERRRSIFKTKQIWFSDSIYDVEGFSNVVFAACKRRHEAPGFICSKNHTSCIDLTLDLHTLWYRMNKKSCRYAIKRAERDDVRVKLNEKYDEFYEIYKSSVRSQKQRGLPEDLKIIKKHGTLFIAEHDDELLGGHVYLADNQIILYWISANKRFNIEGARKTLIGNASHLIHWEAIKYAKQQGLAEFDMGGLFAERGTNYSGYSIDAFKRHFGGKSAIRYYYSKDYSRIYALTKKIAASFLAR